MEELSHFHNVIFVSQTFDDKIIVDFICKNTLEVRDFINQLELSVGKINNYNILEIIAVHKLEDSK